MARSHPARFQRVRTFASVQWVRHTVSGLVLMASLMSLAIILHNQFGARVSATISSAIGALDLTHLFPVAALPSAPVPEHLQLTKHKAVAEFLAKRYRVSTLVMNDIVVHAHAAAEQTKLDPNLILAVIAIESRFNPIAESPFGAKGLMQVIPRFHPEKLAPLGGERVVFEPAANILVGAKILREYLARTGDLTNALQLYVGATTEEAENGYSEKVMLERERLVQFSQQQASRTRVSETRKSAPPAQTAI